MKIFRFSSLALRIIALTMAIGIVLSAIAVGIKISQFEDNILKEATREASTLAEAVALTAESVDDLDTLRRYVMMLSANPNVVTIHILSGEQPTIVASSQFRMIGKSVDSIPAQSEREHLLHSLEHRDTHYDVHKDELAFEAVKPARLFGSDATRRSQPAAVMVDMDYAPIKQAEIHDLIFQIVLFVSLILFSALSSSIFIIKKVIQPLSILKNRIKEEGHLIGRDELKKEDEIQSLVRIHERYASTLEEKNDALNSALMEAQKLASIGQRTTNGVVICNAEGMIEWANPSFTEMTGYELDEVKGKKPGDFLQGEKTDKETVNKLGKAIAEGSPINVDILNYHKDGNEYWIRLDIVPLFANQGKLKNFVAVQTDVSRDKEREIAIIEAKEAAESLAQAKTDFLATMSHEIRTPMNGIVGMLDLLESTPLDQEQKEFVATAENCSETLLSLINDVLDYSKQESMGISLESIEMNLEEEIQRAYQMTGEIARQKGLLFEYNIANDVPVAVIGDPVRLRQLLINLASNAIKFTREGQVSINVSYQGRVDDQHKVEFRITDTGIGIKEETIDKLFNPFTQAQTSTTREFGGTGLGLAICKQICEAMGSKIDVASTPGKGSTFKFILPFRATGTVSATAPSAEPVNLGSNELHVLVAEDNPTQRKTIATQLRELGCEVTTATNGEEALAETELSYFDLILMGCDMPKMDGFETAKRILARDESLHRSSRIVALASVTENDNIELALKSGMESYLTKPVSKTALAGVVSQAALKRLRESI